MKKAWVFVLACLCVSAASAADFKFFVGSSISTYSNRWPSLQTYAYESSGLNPFKNYKAAVTFGFGFTFPIYKSLSIEADVHYANGGADFKMWYVSSGTDGYEEYHDLRGVSLPVLIKAAFLPRPFPYILAGVDITYIINHRRQGFLLYQYGADEQWVGGLVEDFDPSTSKWNFGPILGLGLDFPLKRGAFFIEGRYSLGLTNLYQGAGGAEVMTRALYIIAGYRVGASK